MNSKLIIVDRINGKEDYLIVHVGAKKERLWDVIIKVCAEGVKRGGGMIRQWMRMGKR